MDKILRIIDANFNRTREGLRVVEDGMRFWGDDKLLTEKTKLLRHSLSEVVLKYFPSVSLKKSRQSEIDVGKETDVLKQSILRNIVQNNLSRVSESLRSLEEFSKIVSVKASKDFHKLRFELYSLEKEIVLKLYRKKIPFPCIYVIINLTDGQDIVAFANKVAKGKPGIVQLRYKGEDASYFLRNAKIVRKLLFPETIFIVNDRVDIALLAGADGIHLGKKDISPEQARGLAPDKLIGVSCASRQDIRKYAKEDIDYIAVGSLFLSPTKPDKKVVGTDILTYGRKTITIPLIGIGGINENNVNEVFENGASGAAFISFIERADDPKTSICSLKRKVNKYGRQEKKTGKSFTSE